MYEIIQLTCQCSEESKKKVSHTTLKVLNPLHEDCHNMQRCEKNMYVIQFLNITLKKI
jgi:hypothetical protein